jgi:hypothetical protein
MGGRPRGLWPVAAAAAIVVVTAAGLYVVWRSPHRKDLIDFWGFAAAIAVIAGGRIAWVWRDRSRQASAAVSGQELGRLADLLAGAVEEEWTRAAGERGLLEPEPLPVRWHRPAAPFAGPVAAAVGSKRFLPLPGLSAVGQQRLRAGEIRDLHAVYGGLGSGRLVIAGAPGSGKSGAAVLLVLAALRHREQLPEQDRPRVPVPVMFTLHGWDPKRQPVQDWLATRLSRTYSLLTGGGGVVTAAGLLAAGKVAVILDGLDEIPEQLRPVALRALSQQAAFRVVVLTRSAEMAAAAARGLLEGAAAVELQDIDPVTAAGYLTRVQLDPAPLGWRALTGRIRRSPDSALAHALNSPLTLTLVRDTYRSGDDIRELLHFCDDADRLVSRDDIVDYLLDRVLPAAYAPRPGDPPPRYDLPAAQNAMRHVAARMNQDGTRDLQWWRIYEWAPTAPRIIATGLAFGLTAGLLAGLGFGPGFGLTVALGAGLLFGLPVGFRGEPSQMPTVRWRQLLRPPTLAYMLTAGLTSGLTAGLAVGLAIGLTVSLMDGLAAGLAVGLAVGLTGGLTGAFSRAGTDNASPLSPLTSWRSNRANGLGFGLTVGLTVGLAIGLTSGLAYGLAHGLAVGLAVGLTVALAFGLLGGRAYGLAAGLLVGLTFGLPAGLTAGRPVGLAVGLAAGLTFGLVVGSAGGLMYTSTWSAALTFAQLAARWHTPIRLMRFLDDARDRNVLRTVGPVYQFRHARLQDRLAGQESGIGEGPGGPQLAEQDAETPTAESK